MVGKHTCEKLRVPPRRLRSILILYITYYSRMDLFYSTQEDIMAKKIKKQLKKKLSIDPDKPFTFELVMADRDYQGKPTGRMRKSFSTDDVSQLSDNYQRNSGQAQKNKKAKKAKTA